MRKINKIGIIGVGNMGQSLAIALRDKKIGKVHIFDCNQSKMKLLKGFCCCKNTQEVIQKSDILIIAIKPQDINALLFENKTFFQRKKNLLILSIAAGISTEYYERKLPHLRVIRVMPNLAVQINESVSFICKGLFAKNSDVLLAKKIFLSVGTVFVVNEKYINAATAISGSGPGYIYFFMNAFYKAALMLGFSSTLAHGIVLQTFIGAAKLAAQSGKEFQTLMDNVASSRGTTQAAFTVFEHQKLSQIICEGVTAANRRACEITSQYMAE